MSTTTTKAKRRKTAEHRPAVRRRRFRHDELTAVDLFSGFGGLTRGIRRAGVTTIMAANHNPYKIEVHEANEPECEHWIADLVDETSGDYHSAADLPPADMLVAGISCVHHSQANAKKAYAQGLNLFTMDDPDWEARVTRSERDRATAVCVLQYAEKNAPRVMLIECTTELTSWGPALPNKPKVGDGSSYRWWLNEVHKLGYRSKTLYLNSQFFGVPQSRDRIYICFWRSELPTPDLEHRPPSWCFHCDRVVEAVWSWRTRIPPTGSVRYGKQYDYRCPSCNHEVIPPMTPSLAALDLTDLGTRIGDRDRPLAASTMARAERCRQRFADFPAVLMPAKALPRGSDRHPWQPMATQTSQQETAVLSTGALVTAAGNTFEWNDRSMTRIRRFDQPLWTQHATNAAGLLTPPTAMALMPYRNGNQPVPTDQPLPTQASHESMAVVSAPLANRTNATPTDPTEPMPTLVGGAGSGGVGVISSGVLPFRANTIPPTHGEPMPTFTSEQVPGVLTAAGVIKNNGAIGEAQYRARPVDEPLGTVVGSGNSKGLLFSGWFKQNGGPADTAPHPMSDPWGTLTSRDTTGLLMADWRAQLADLPLEDCYFRMMFAHEVGVGCGFDVDHPAYGDGGFIVWGSTRDQVDGFGNAVSPQVGEFIGGRLRAIL
ncbi:DNA cytosine methyltransferase [Desertimonas flava]|uniref:DNA cytosine methyltransferase n=1 Tax=Desertimonas flava TaxID=2064846 RepID=UPI000E348EAC|nr:DNA cytosine methyltransferase [Desertimonas flava]